MSTDQPTRTFFLTAEEGRVENRSENRGGTWINLDAISRKFWNLYEGSKGLRIIRIITSSEGKDKDIFIFVY